jgi:hypothetical protein
VGKPELPLTENRLTTNVTKEGIEKLDLRAYLDAIFAYVYLIVLFRAPKKDWLYLIWLSYDSKLHLNRLITGRCMVLPDNLSRMNTVIDASLLHPSSHLPEDLAV